MTVVRIRGRKLQERRRAHFALHPLCARCLERGHTSLATELDHIVALTNGGGDGPENEQGLCGQCHKDKTQEDMGRTVRRIGEDGWPLDDRSNT